MAVQFDDNIVTIWRDEDVLDTWFSSALWPFSTLGWPDETKELDRYYPTNVLVTGFDIIFFWVARMMMMGLYFKKEIPFHDVYIHALVRDEKGAKMSKSKGNVIDPFTSSTNMAPMRCASPSRPWRRRDATSSSRRSASKATAISRPSCGTHRASPRSTAAPAFRASIRRSNEITLNRWIVSEAARAAGEVAAAIEAYRFNDAAAAAYRFVWNVFCDWYLELAKPLLQGEDGAGKDETRATTAFLLDQIYALLHPFMPFITEELWGIEGFEGPARESPLALAQWPELDGLEDAAGRSRDRLGRRSRLGSALGALGDELPAGAKAPLLLIGAMRRCKRA